MNERMECRDISKKAVKPKISWNEVLELRVISHFDPSEIEYLYEQYKSLCTSSLGITKEIFYQCLGPLALRKNVLVDQMFKFYDLNGNGYISFPEFVRGLSIITKGTQAEKMKFVFKAYDVDSDNFISREDLLKVLQAHHQVNVELVRDVVRSCEEEMMENYDDSGNRPISAIFNAPIPQRPLRDDGLRATEINSSNTHTANKRAFSAVEAMAHDALYEVADYIFKRADTDRDDKISYNDFKNYVLVDPSVMTWFESIGPVF
eukprot:gene11503-12698_t